MIWRYAIGRSLSIWNARMMQLHIFLWSHSRRTRARSSSSFVPLADFKLQLRLRDMMGELSRGVRGVVFVFDLLLNFQFVFSLLDTFGHRPVRTASFSRTSSWTCLWTPSWVSLSVPPQTPSWTPPSKVTHFLLTALHRTATFGPDPDRPSFDLGQTPLGTDPGGVPSEPKHTVKPQWRSKFY